MALAPAKKGYTRHEVTAPRAVGPSGRTSLLGTRPKKNLQNLAHLSPIKICQLTDHNHHT